MTGPGLCAVAVAFHLFLNDEPSWLAFVLIPVGVVLASRGYRMGVRCSNTEVVVYGFLFTRVISKRAIMSANTDVDGLPSLWWRSNSGRRRWTPIFVFLGTNEEFRFIHVVKMRRLEQLRGWLDRGPRGDRL